MPQVTNDYVGKITVKFDDEYEPCELNLKPISQVIHMYICLTYTLEMVIKRNLVMLNIMMC